MPTAIPGTVMRGGTSKGLFFLRDDLPAHPKSRDELLRRALGSPDARQIDGMGGAHPLTSKVAVVGRPTRGNADVDYLFLQVAVDSGEVSANQNCGNILAGVGPFAIEQNLVAAGKETTDVRIHMVNSGSIAVARVQTPRGEVTYDGTARIDGVPGTAAAIMITFEDTAGSSCGTLLPTGNVRDTIDGFEFTAIDNGMPIVVLKASDFGLSGHELPDELESNDRLRDQVEQLRLKIGPLMNLDDVREKTIPKMCLVAAPAAGGSISTRTFIPHRVHEAVGVLGAVSVASACVLTGSIAEEVSDIENKRRLLLLDVEHPTGAFTVELDVGSDGEIRCAALLRTARKLMQGVVYC